MPDPSAFDWTKFANDFSIAAVGALAGAFAGAMGAQRIAERSKVRDELLKEVRNVNAAVTMAYGITDTSINFKRQHMKPVYDRFQASKAALLKFQEEHKEGEIFEYEIDLLRFSLFPVPTAEIQQILFERVTAPTRTISLVNVIGRTVHGLEELITARGQLIEEFRMKDGLHPAIYFGLRVPDGADMRYASTLEGMNQYTDDLIHFSRMLGDDLLKYGIELKDRLPKKFRAAAPVIVFADFSKGADVMPSPEKYRDWETMFSKLAKPVTGLNFWASTPPD
jgi:hypothetical protein